MKWTHEELKSFPTENTIKYNLIVDQTVWIRVNSLCIEILLKSDGTIDIVSGYWSNGSGIPYEKNWSNLKQLPSSTSGWKLILTPMYNEYDPKQQPYEDDDI